MVGRPGLARVTIDGPRRSSGSFQLYLGMPLARVSRILGHSSLVVTAALYELTLDDGERGVMERLGALLASDARLVDRLAAEPVASCMRRDDAASE
jgi:integrase